MYKCPVCAEAMNVGDKYSQDIELGPCHAECLADSPAVNLDTGEPMSGEPAVYVWEQRDADDYLDEVPTNAEGVTIQ